MEVISEPFGNCRGGFGSAVDSPAFGLNGFDEVFPVLFERWRSFLRLVLVVLHRDLGELNSRPDIRKGLVESILRRHLEMLLYVIPLDAPQFG